MVRQADQNELPAVLTFLADAGLPTAGLCDHLDHLFVFESEGLLFGAIAFEAYPPYALLRSLVVAPEARGQGRGRELMDFVIE
jgi:amino-acid N-acetyltransferase